MNTSLFTTIKKIVIFFIISNRTDPSAGKCFAIFSITILHPGLVMIGICNLGSGSLCQLSVDLGSFNKILTLPSLNFFLKYYKLLQNKCLKIRN